jgi:acetyltransferase-like isoleucine patch superfamily enzyme
MSRLKKIWIRFWLKQSGLTKSGRMAFRLASWFAPPHKRGVSLAMMTPSGYIVPSAVIFHPDIQLGVNVYIGDRVQIFGDINPGKVIIGDRVRIFRDTIIDTGNNGSLTIGSDTSIHPRCQLNAYLTSINIGKGVMLAANCCMYPHDHGMAPDRPIIEQPVQTKGPIVIGDHAWLGTGVIVLGGVSIGKGAVIGAGAVVTKDIPENAIAVGMPAKVVKMR